MLVLIYFYYQDNLVFILYCNYFLANFYSKLVFEVVDASACMFCLLHTLVCFGIDTFDGNSMLVLFFFLLTINDRFIFNHNL